MIAYLRSTLFTTVAVGIAVLAAWPAGPVAVNASTPDDHAEAVREAYAASQRYFVSPNAQNAALPLRTTSANLDQQYTRRAQLVRANTGIDAAVPLSADHLVADLSLPAAIPLEAALAQVDRIAAARNLDHALVLGLVQQYTEYAPFGVGEPMVNAPFLNLALDAFE
jgi:K+-transporting ATPase c subunit